MCAVLWPSTSRFLSTPSARRATSSRCSRTTERRYFYPRPPRGGRQRARFRSSSSAKFLSTPSARRATFNWRPVHVSGVFLSTPSARRATPVDFSRGVNVRISIHALREEGDRWCCRESMNQRRFLSTPSARRATWWAACWLVGWCISIHALREEGDEIIIAIPNRKAISIHALREEGDDYRLGSGFTSDDFYPRPPRGGRLDDLIHALANNGFLSTPSARRATGLRRAWKRMQTISIHALREEGDTFWIAVYLVSQQFLSTPSARRATNQPFQFPTYFTISIHALREEGDLACRCTSTAGRYFYPRPPRGGRRSISLRGLLLMGISIHALREEGDQQAAARVVVAVEISIHALREEGDPAGRDPHNRTCDFYPRPPRGGRRFTVRPVKVSGVFLSTPSARRATR